MGVAKVSTHRAGSTARSWSTTLNRMVGLVTTARRVLFVMRVLASQKRVRTCWCVNIATRESTTLACLRYLIKDLRFGTVTTVDLPVECNQMETLRRCEQMSLTWSRRQQPSHFSRIGQCLDMRMMTQWTVWTLLIHLPHSALKHCLYQHPHRLPHHLVSPSLLGQILQNLRKLKKINQNFSNPQIKSPLKKT